MGKKSVSCDFDTESNCSNFSIDILKDKTYDYSQHMASYKTLPVECTITVMNIPDLDVKKKDPVFTGEIECNMDDMEEEEKNLVEKMLESDFSDESASEDELNDVFDKILVKGEEADQLCYDLMWNSLKDRNLQRIPEFYSLADENESSKLTKKNLKKLNESNESDEEYSELLEKSQSEDDESFAADVRQCVRFFDDDFLSDDLNDDNSKETVDDLIDSKKQDEMKAARKKEKYDNLDAKVHKINSQFVKTYMEQYKNENDCKDLSKEHERDLAYKQTDLQKDNLHKHSPIHKLNKYKNQNKSDKKSKKTPQTLHLDHIL